MGALAAVKERLATSDTSARMHRRVFRASSGRIGARVEGRPVLLLKTTGRRTGRRREVVIVYYEHNGRYLVVPSNAAHPDREPNWWRNLQTHPAADILVDGQWLRVAAVALSDEERDRLWPTLSAHNPHWDQAQRSATRRFPVVALMRIRSSEGATVVRSADLEPGPVRCRTCPPQRR